MTNADDLAFIKESQTDVNVMQYPLTKREYFAAMAMQGMSAACRGYDNNGLDNLAKCAVQAADALINELNK
jgi:hypothetical protein